jgi:murein DD-endopeptidase MepM/ murein hydrolase activator NlpD
VPIRPHAPPVRHASPERRRRAHAVRLAVAAAVLGVAALIVVPALEPIARPRVVDGLPQALVAAAQQPSPGRATDAAATDRSAAPWPTPSPAPAARNRGPVGSTTRAAVTNPGVPPSRLAAELSGTHPPDPDILTGYQWPLAHPRLTLPFGPTPWGTRVVDGQLFHDGIDMATFCGDHVVAAHDGTVLTASRRFDDLIGWVGDLGPYYGRLDRRHAWMTLPILVVIDDGNGYRSMYAHFSEVVVRNGQKVKAGELLGYEGATGHATGCHVHYGLFSPWETRTFRTEAGVANRMKLPRLEIARIDPKAVLPPKPPAQSKPSEPVPTGG